MPNTIVAHQSACFNIWVWHGKFAGVANVLHFRIGCISVPRLEDRKTSAGNCGQRKLGGLLSLGQSSIFYSLCLEFHSSFYLFSLVILASSTARNFDFICYPFHTMICSFMYYFFTSPIFLYLASGELATRDKDIICSSPMFPSIQSSLV